ncbi:DnaB-like helicase N-terminal domain-containing protein [Mycobacterium avium]|uniref:DnaB-like helicase N-terminal domain-containing protein n=2 Tax=Mycobacterium avium TaxID=1764 RepID=UPI0015942105|nr:DnaB-like helicase N-terminal domain-containing protein [Mycobacterium avium]
MGQLPDVETVFVGTLMWSSPADVTAALELVADDDFESPALSVLVSTIRRLAVAGQPCDAQIVLDELSRAGRVNRAIALALMDATTSGAVPQAARFYGAVVLARSLRRRVESAGNALVEAAQAGAESQLAALVSAATVSVLDCAGRLAELRGEA